MIERTLRDILKASDAVKNRVDGRIYAGNAPQGVRGECVVLDDVTDEHYYHLFNEADLRSSIVQVDCYAEKSYDARTLFEVIRNVLSGRQDLDNAIQSCTIVGGVGSIVEEPEDRSDRWFYRYSKDFQVMHVESVPTHT